MLAGLLARLWRSGGGDTADAAPDPSVSVQLRSSKDAFLVARRLTQRHNTGDADALHVYVRRHPAVLAKRSPATRNTLFHLAAEAGELNLLRAFVQLVRLHSREVRAAVYERYLVRLGGGPRDLSDDRALLLKLLNGANSEGLTALHLAACEGHADVVGLLLELGADPWRRDQWWFRTPLHCAAIGGQPACVTVLVHRMRNEHDEHGTRYIDSTTGTGLTALHYAAALGPSHGHAAAARALVHAGASLSVAADVSSMSQDFYVPRMLARSTPLHLAAAAGNAQTVRDILQSYAAAVALHRSPRPDPRRARDSTQSTPYDIAMCAGHRDLAALLDLSQDLPTLLEATSRPVVGPNPASQVTSLAALAAEALHAKLRRDLTAAAAAATVGSESRPQQRKQQPLTSPPPPPLQPEQQQQQQQQQASAPLASLPHISMGPDPQQAYVEACMIADIAAALSIEGGSGSSDVEDHRACGSGDSRAPHACSEGDVVPELPPPSSFCASSHCGGHASGIGSFASGGINSGSSSTCATGISSSLCINGIGASGSDVEVLVEGFPDASGCSETCSKQDAGHVSTQQHHAPGASQVNGSGSTCSSRRSSASGGRSVCYVCMDQYSDVTVSGCSHSLCSGCAGVIVAQAAAARRPTALPCPFCRTPIGGFGPRHAVSGL